MLHEDMIGRFSEYRLGKLAPKERLLLRGHLESCSHCRMLYRGWNGGMPRHGFAEGVMARLEKREKPLPWDLTHWWASFSAAAVAALIIAAFWHPERSWLKADRYFGLWNARQQSLSTLPSKGWGRVEGTL